MPIETLPEFFTPMKSTLNAFEKEAKERALSKLELALGFVLGIGGIDYVVVGVNVVEQLREVIDAASSKVDIKSFQALSLDDINFVNPSYWDL